ncbi:MAG: PQQ-dependent sugar dehydrogenase [Lentisphaerae bacterium]|nr:PQQ-dependent sugar dehydrogenase [Lentisphaerota bacterium]
MHTRLLILWGRTLAVLVPCLAAAQEAAPSAPAKVEQVYAQHCAACHGDHLDGGLGGSLIDGDWQRGGTDTAIARAIAGGNPDMGMPAFLGTLSPDQRRALVIYIREQEALAAQKRTPPPVPSPESITHTQHHDYRIQTVVADGLQTPWSLAFLPDGRNLVTERAGGLRVMAADGALQPDPVRGTPEVVAHGQGGMLAVAAHPAFATNGWIYLGFSEGWRVAGRPFCITAIARGRILDNQWVDHQWIYRAERRFHTGAGVHFGTRIVFRDGDIFFVVGERGGGMEAQDLTRPNGKIFRLRDDGRVPEDNPFVGTPGAVPGIWSYGHRNPQGLALAPRNGDLYATEHGPRGGDELNLIKRGGNYGWPVITYGMNYDGTPMTALTAMGGMEQPVAYWTPSIAACGLAFYTGDRFTKWNGDLFTGSLKAQELRRLRLIDRQVVEQEIILKNIGRVRDVVCGPDGYLYVVLNEPDRIVRLVPAE